MEPDLAARLPLATSPRPQPSGASSAARPASARHGKSSSTRRTSTGCSALRRELFLGHAEISDRVQPAAGIGLGQALIAAAIAASSEGASVTGCQLPFSPRASARHSRPCRPGDALSFRVRKLGVGRWQQCARDTAGFRNLGRQEAVDRQDEAGPSPRVGRSSTRSNDKPNGLTSRVDECWPKYHPAVSANAHDASFTPAKRSAIAFRSAVRRGADGWR